MKQSYCIILVTLILVLVTIPLFGSCSTPEPGPEVKAAIVDQLSILWTNEEFTQEATQQLEAYGFKVDVYRGEEVSVKFYRELPKYGYKLIIFRAHSGIMGEIQGSEVLPQNTTYLFAAEPYSRNKYAREQLTDQLVAATMTEDYPDVFAINSKFILESMEGRFENTAIIMMGCSTTYASDMATAFCMRGASTYLGWDATVGLNYVDEATINLIDNLYIKYMTIEQAVAETMAEVGPDPVHKAHLQYYPTEPGNKTIDELIGS